MIKLRVMTAAFTSWANALLLVVMLLSTNAMSGSQAIVMRLNSKLSCGTVAESAFNERLSYCESSTIRTLFDLSRLALSRGSALSAFGVGDVWSLKNGERRRIYLSSFS